MSQGLDDLISAATMSHINAMDATRPQLDRSRVKLGAAACLRLEIESTVDDFHGNTDAFLKLP